jgi:enoyl-CoA hydratase/carnithine racemase
VSVASGDAVRWFLLTAEEFGATEALRIGLVQEVVPAGQQLDRAVAIACAVAAQAPLGFREPWPTPGRGAPRPSRAAAAQLRELLPDGACEPGRRREAAQLR